MRIGQVLLIVVVAILVIGPKDFPIMLKKIGSWIGSIKKYFSELQSEVSLNEHEIDYFRHQRTRLMNELETATGMVPSIMCCAVG
jgi:sec-independent protein translocase protein TatB